MVKIKFGTDGWRAIIAKEFTVDNVIRVIQGVSIWIKNKGLGKVVVGHDSRFGGQLFSQTATRVFGANGIKVHLAKNIVSSPMVSLGVVKTKSDFGVAITASHNLPTYNGIKLKSHFGGPVLVKNLKEIENLIPDSIELELPNLEEMFEMGLLNYVDLQSIYFNQVEQYFDLNAIRNSGFALAYDAMYGAGIGVLPRLFPDAVLLHCEENPGYGGLAPEPIESNLKELSDLLKNNEELMVGLATDGDADRIGMYDEDGSFVDAHHLLLLLMLYLNKYKELKGKVLVTSAVTEKIHKLAQMFDLEVGTTKIGFEYISEIIILEEVLIAGCVSGGVAVNGHIPDKDGIWAGLLILEFMAKTGKSLKTLVSEIHEMVGQFYFKSFDLDLNNEQIKAILNACKTDSYQSFGNFKVKSIETMDVYKFLFGENEWLIILPSQTEPVLRISAQAATATEAQMILDAAKDTLLTVEVS